MKENETDKKLQGKKGRDREEWEMAPLIQSSNFKYMGFYARFLFVWGSSLIMKLSKFTLLSLSLCNLSCTLLTNSCLIICTN